MDQSKQGLLSDERDGRGSLDSQLSYDDNDDDDNSSIDVAEIIREEQRAAILNKFDEEEEEHGRAAQTVWQRCYRLLLLRRWTVIAASILLAVLGTMAAFGGVAYEKIGGSPPYGQSPPWYPSPKGGTAPSWATSYAKAADMVRRMTLPEKVNITTGVGWEMGLAVGSTGPAVHAGFPQLNFQDGPLGIRMADNITAFPAGVTVGATWNKQLMFQRGEAHAREARGKNLHGLLGPCVGPLGRMPAGGRNWEGFGADPYLQGIAGAETIRGIQSQGIMATVKHFVANEQEHFRQPWEWGLPHALSANVDDRALHELYAWPFGDAVKAGVASVMCSYNMVNNSYACGNSKLLNGILKDELGFQGFVMSDWLAQHSGVSTALAGLDMTMPGDGLKWQDGKSLWGAELTRAVLNGSVPVDRLNDMVTRIVAAWYQLGQDDADFKANDGPNFSSWTDEETGVFSPGSPSPQQAVRVNQFVNVQSNHSELARRIAAEGTVLLKNADNCLPLASKPKKALKVGIFGEDAGPGQGPNFCKDRGCNQGTLGMGWGSGAVEYPYLVSPVEALVAGFDAASVAVAQHLDNRVPAQAELDGLDVCIVFANADSGEGYMAWGGVGGDRNDLRLQKNGDDLIAAVASGCGGANKGETIVVIHSVGPVLMERWIDLPTVKAVVYANLPGEESGNALADVLFGRVNPSGKLPYTIGRSLSDYGPGATVMYLPNSLVPQQDFSEGLYVDYRHFDKQGVAPRFEFGFGLSYTTFAVGNLTVQPVPSTKRALPLPRPATPKVTPPEYDDTIPDKATALFPSGLRRLQKYVYPYLERVDDIVLGSGKGGYPYPDGYDQSPPLSAAGGDEGGNPDLWETCVTVHVDVRNTGTLAGQAVVQLYLAYPEGAADARGVDFPVKVLRGFEKLALESGAAQTVAFNLTRRDLSYWDTTRQNWVMVTGGEYRFLVGQSSRDLPLEGRW